MTPDYVRVYEGFRAVMSALERRGLWTAGAADELGPLLDAAGDNPLLVPLLEIFTAIFENVLRLEPPEDRAVMDEFMTTVGPRLMEHNEFVLRHLMGRPDRYS